MKYGIYQIVMGAKTFDKSMREVIPLVTIADILLPLHELKYAFVETIPPIKIYVYTD